MPSLALRTGQGAGEGLEKLLTRLAQEHLVAQKEAEFNRTATENERSNRADEGLRRDNLTETSAQRALTAKSLDDARHATDADRDNSRVMQMIKLQARGADVSPQDYATQRAAGAPANLYDKTPGAKVSTFKGFSLIPQPGTSGAGMPGAPQPSALPDTQAQPPSSVDRIPQAGGSPMDAPDRISFKGTPEENRLDDKTPTAPSMEMKTVTYRGKPVDANYNPKTGAFTYQGQDITKEVGHYTAPDRTLVSTDNGILPRPDVAAAAGKGTPMQPPLTSSTRTMQEAAQMVEPHIQDIQNQAKALNQHGNFGPVMSRIRHLAEQAGSLDDFSALLSSDPSISQDEAVGKFATSLGLLASGAARVHYGGRAGSSPAAIQGFKQMVSDSSTLEMFLGRVGAMDDYMKTYAAGPPPSGGAKGAPAAPSADPFEEYLKRTRKP